jgi:hypothetical protein
MLGMDEEWLHELSIEMFPEDGCLHVYHGEDDAVTGFTDYGSECLNQIISDAEQPSRRCAAIARRNEAACGAHRNPCSLRLLFVDVGLRLGDRHMRPSRAWNGERAPYGR